MAKTTSFTDCRRFATDVRAAGGELPQTLQNLIQAHSVLTAAAPPPGAPTGANDAIIDAVLDGSLTEVKLAELLPEAAAKHATVEYAKQVSVDAERVLLQTWHRTMDKGGAEAILTSMRPQFDQRVKEIAKARALFTAESDAEFVLAGAPREVVDAWQSLDEHLKIIGRIVLVARQFGAKPTAQFPQIVELANADNFRLSDEALMCCDGNLEVESSYFQRPDRGHRTSPLFRVSLKLHSIESARARYNAWAAEQWDNSHSGPGQSYLVDGKLVPIAKPKNPYRESTNSK